MSKTPANVLCQIRHGDTTPRLRLNDEMLDLLGTTSTLSFDTSMRYCTGWHELSTGTSHPCPDSATTDARFEVCAACQRRTGFNPAFYHAATISPQQEQRNAEPHLLYLAYMGTGYIKVGISWAQRGHTRLLDQGALAFIPLDVFPTALIARQYEAKLAAHPDFHETTPTKKKLHLLSHAYDEAAALASLMAAKTHAEQLLGIRLSGDTAVSLIEHYFYTKETIPSVENIHTLEQPLTSGTHIGLVGDILLTQHTDQIVALPLKKFYGYPLAVDRVVRPLDLPATQLGLF